MICYGQAVPSDWQTYRSPDYGFSIEYPVNMTFYPGRPDYVATQLSYIPICDYTTVACFEYNGREYEGTNFEAAGLSVNVLRDMKTEGTWSQRSVVSGPNENLRSTVKNKTDHQDQP